MTLTITAYGSPVYSRKSSCGNIYKLRITYINGKKSAYAIQCCYRASKTCQYASPYTYHEGVKTVNALCEIDDFVQSIRDDWKQLRDKK